VWRLKFDVWNFTRICHEENKNLSYEIPPGYGWRKVNGCVSPHARKTTSSK